MLGDKRVKVIPGDNEELNRQTEFMKRKLAEMKYLIKKTYLCNWLKKKHKIHKNASFNILVNKDNF